MQSSLFENLLLKKFSRVIVVYCSIIKVLFTVLFKRQLLYFIKSFSLCQELFYFSVSFAIVKCYCITFSKKFELTENAYSVNVFMLVCVLLYVKTLNFIIRQLNL